MAYTYELLTGGFHIEKDGKKLIDQRIDYRVAGRNPIPDEDREQLAQEFIAMLEAADTARAEAAAAETPSEGV